MKAERSRVKKSIANYAAAIANGATSGTIIELINAAEAKAAALDEAIAERELVAAPPKVSKEAIEYFLRNIAAAPDDKMKEKVISTMVNSVVVERVPDEGTKKDSDENIPSLSDLILPIHRNYLRCSPSMFAKSLKW